MSDYKTIAPEQLTQNPFAMIGKDWMLITAEKDGKANTMTASWGGFGVMWGKNVAYIVLRPQRYTKEFVDQAETFSLSFLDDSFRAALNYLGSKSGRDGPQTLACHESAQRNAEPDETGHDNRGIYQRRILYPPRVTNKTIVEDNNGRRNNPDHKAR